MLPWKQKTLFMHATPVDFHKGKNKMFPGNMEYKVR